MDLFLVALAALFAGGWLGRIGASNQARNEYAEKIAILCSINEHNQREVIRMEHQLKALGAQFNIDHAEVKWPTKL